MPSQAIENRDLSAWAENAARDMHTSGRCRGRAEERHLRYALGYLTRYAESGEGEEGVLRWLRDNLHLLRTALEDAMADFAHCSRMKKCGRQLRICACAEALVQSGFAPDAERCTLFLEGFQNRSVLSERELELFPAALSEQLLLALCELLHSGNATETEVGKLITAIRFCSTESWTPLLESVNRSEGILRRDCAGIYPEMDAESRRDYRRRLEQLSRRRGVEEHVLAERLLRESNEAGEHVGFALFGREASREGSLYMAANVLLTLFFTLLSAFSLRSAAAGFLLLLPLSDCVKALCDSSLSRLTRPRRLPRLELRDGVPEEGRTLCAISLLLTDEEQLKESVQRLREYRYASRDCGRNLLFGLLCDFPDSAEAENPGEPELLRKAAGLVEELNLSMGGGFFLFSRPRREDSVNGGYRGFERKRGALLALCELLREQSGELRTEAGDTAQLRNIRYILALDSDTRLTPGAARSLIGAMLHPLNRCVLDRERGLVTAGYGVIQPKLSTELEGSTRSDFARFFSAQGGISSYRGCGGELYFDRFDSGGFSGKGILDADALLCISRKHLPNGQILSHDALEGAFLRAGLCEDVELTDRFPGSPLSYGRRQKRWVRGDWQNLPWLFSRGKLLRPIERWRLFDSLRRSLVDFGALSGLLSAFFFPALRPVGLLTLFSLFFRLLLSLLSTMLQKEENVRYRLLSRLLHGCAGAFSRTLLSLLLLPWFASLGFFSALRALWRLYGTKRRLLEWETAAQSDGGRNDLMAYVRALRFSLFVGLLCLLAPAISGKAAGMLWLFSPLLLHSLGREKQPPAPLSAEDRDYLTRRAKELWRWFERFCDEENHYLPPDNLQELPAVGLAHRTSPTNVGLMLVSALSALDLGLTGQEEAAALISHTLSTLEQLPKWEGHLYNWYDTRSLRILEPAYISTVDSGNLCACLTALAPGLEEYGLHELAQRARQLRDAMDFTPLYDKDRELFRIGYSVAQGKADAGHYDLLESEQRLCAYYAIASGQVSVRHWSALSRAPVEFDGYRGCASWSGSMFEYLMPDLFLPLESCSLLSESARFCVYVQSRYRFGRERVWGKSESAYFSLDGALNYRYKAHGVQALSLSREKNRECVVAPYAAFLALGVRRDRAVDDLRRFERVGALGPWGFWDAVDYTPERCGREGKIVRTVMAHHMGMSMTALTNCLRDNIWQQRFMREGAMSAYRTLLQERLPLGGPLLHRKKFLLPVRASSERDGFALRSGKGCSVRGGAVQPLSNGSYSLFLTESGLSMARWGQLLPYRCPENEAADCRGVECFLELDGERFSLLPCSESVGHFRWEFSGKEALWEGQRGALHWILRVSVSESDNAERRILTLRGLPEHTQAAVYWGFEPVLAPPEELRSARSYTRLGLGAEKCEEGYLITRLPRNGRRELYLFCSTKPEAKLCADYFVFPGRDRCRSFAPALGAQSASFCTLRQELHPQGGSAEAILALSVGEERERTVADGLHALRSRSSAAMADSAARLLGMDGTDERAALSLLPRLLFPALCAEAESMTSEGRQSLLWPWGISGDLPIVALELSERSLRTAAMAVKHHALLTCCGVRYDLVFLAETDGEYRPGPRLALEELLRRLGQEGRIGQRGGCHFCDSSAAPVVISNSVLLLDESGRIPTQPRSVSDEPLCIPELLAPQSESVCEPCEESRGEDGEYRLTIRGLLPERTRSHILANPDFGALFSECGCMLLWYRNARECPLLTPANDPLAERAPETLEAKINGQWVSLFARRGERCRVSYGFGYARWEKSVEGVTLSLTATVPLGRSERIYTIRVSEPLELRWVLPLQLAAEGRDRSFCALWEEDGVLHARSKRCGFPGLTLKAVASVPWLGHNLSPEPRRAAESAFSATLLAEGETVLRLGVGEFSEEAEACEETGRAWREKLSRIRVESASAELDRLMNGWAVYQTLVGRLWGRCSLYQSGGAIGFRDQLQDAVNLIDFDPSLCRNQLIIAAGHQFEEGDCQHWWHPGPTVTHRGCRSRCSDDLLWLVWALCEYVEKTGDREICLEKAGYLHSFPLTADEKSRYELPELSRRRETLMEHCRRALELVLERGRGQHGLLLMLGGDWNDALDEMGEGAESVWLSFFFALCARSFAALLDSLGEGDGEYFRGSARELIASCESCWNGSYYPRAYYGDGRQLGTVDATVQAFAALCPGVDSEHADRALSTAMEALYDRSHRLLKLSAAPYTREHSPGYISSYGPGFRENGGQYTHAALFLSHALFSRGRSGEGWELLRCAMPEGRGRDFGLEPYVIPADISVNPGCVGRGGWSWYTGSAGWFYRVALEDLLCCRRSGGEFVQKPPHLPEGLGEARVEVK